MVKTIALVQKSASNDPYTIIEKRKGKEGRPPKHLCKGKTAGGYFKAGWLRFSAAEFLIFRDITTNKNVKKEL